MLQALKWSLLFDFVPKSCSHRDEKYIRHHNNCQEDFMGAFTWVRLRGFSPIGHEQSSTGNVTGYGGSEHIKARRARKVYG